MSKIKALLAALSAAILLSGCGQHIPKADTFPEAESTAVSESVSEETSSPAADESSEAAQAPAVTEDSSEEPASTNDDSSEDPDSAEPDTAEPEGLSAEALLENMTTEQKIGQLFIVSPEALSSSDGAVTEYDDSIAQTLKKYPVGGIIYFTANVREPEQLSRLTEGLSGASETPLFFTTDEEGGVVTRVAANPAFDVQTYSSMYSIGQSGEPDKAFEVGKTIGAYLKEYGFNLDFAPVADVYTNPANVVIGWRAFSSDPDIAAELVSACVDGFHESGMICTLKHFPGHGDTTADSHNGYVAVYKTWDELAQCELKPFIKSLDRADMIMAAHITLPNVTDDGLPASLSKGLLTDKLRNELGYEGVIITDSMSMKAVSDSYPTGDAAVAAINAGADIILMPASLSNAFTAVADAVESGEISEERLNESVKRVLALKIKYGIIKE